MQEPGVSLEEKRPTNQYSSEGDAGSGGADDEETTQEGGDGGVWKGMSRQEVQENLLDAQSKATSVPTHTYDQPPQPAHEAHKQHYQDLDVLTTKIKLRTGIQELPIVLVLLFCLSHVTSAPTIHTLG